MLVWQAKPGLSALRFLGHRGPVHAARFSPSGRYLATAGADATVHLWEPNARGASWVNWVVGGSGTINQCSYIYTHARSTQAASR